MLLDGTTAICITFVSFFIYKTITTVCKLICEAATEISENRKEEAKYNYLKEKLTKAEDEEEN